MIDGIDQPTWKRVWTENGKICMETVTDYGIAVYPPVKQEPAMKIVTQELFDEVCNERQVRFSGISETARMLLRQLSDQNQENVEVWFHSGKWDTPGCPSHAFCTDRYRIRGGKDTTLIRAETGLERYVRQWRETAPVSGTYQWREVAGASWFQVQQFPLGTQVGPYAYCKFISPTPVIIGTAIHTQIIQQTAAPAISQEDCLIWKWGRKLREWMFRDHELALLKRSVAYFKQCHSEVCGELSSAKQELEKQQQIARDNIDAYSRAAYYRDVARQDAAKAEAARDRAQYAHQNALDYIPVLHAENQRLDLELCLANQDAARDGEAITSLTNELGDARNQIDKLRRKLRTKK